MEFALIAVLVYAVWCCVVELREETLCRLYSSDHGWTCYAIFPLWVLLAPANVLAYGAGPLGGNTKDLSRFTKDPRLFPIRLSPKGKLLLIFVSLITFAWSIWILFGATRALFVLVFLVCHEGSHALWGRHRQVRIMGVGGLPFLGAFVAFEKGTPPELMGEIALAGLLGGLLALPLAWFFADPLWNVCFTLNLTLLNALPWGPLDGKKCWLVLAPKARSFRTSFYRWQWTILCLAVYLTVQGFYSLR